MTVRRRRSDRSGRSKLHSPGRPDSAPADDAPGVEVEHDGQVQPALCRPDIADVGSPFLVGCLGGEVLVEKVRCDGLVVLAVRRLFELLVPSASS